MGTVHVVATPIGNLEDITLRAVRVLSQAHRIYAEDTRRTRVLLEHHGIPGRAISLHSRNEEARIAEALESLGRGEDLAIVSDAGTPMISDPGARLAAAAAEAGYRIESVPGASAVLAALTASGLRTHPFTFLGFLARRGGGRRRLLASYRDRPEALVVFEAPGRVGETLKDLEAALGGERRACLARELTKLHEEVVRGSLAELSRRFAEGARGEVTLVIEAQEGAELPATDSLLDEAQLGRRLADLAGQGRRPREIAAILAPVSALPRRELYARAVAQREALVGEDETDEEPEAPSV